MKKKKYWFPAICSALVIGLGQIMKSDSKKGLKLILWSYFYIPTALYVAFIINSRLFIVALAIAVIAYPIMWLYNVLDALLKKANI